MHGAASHGGRRSKKRGTSVEFADYREYTHGDDLRQIDWNVYGRSDRLYVKLREDEESLTVHVLVDCSRSMDWGATTSWTTPAGSPPRYAAPGSQDRVQVAGFHERLLAPLPAARQTGRLFGFLRGSSRGADRHPPPLRPTPRCTGAAGWPCSSRTSNPGARGPDRPPRPRPRGRPDPPLDPVETDPDAEGEVELYDRESGSTLRISLDPATVELQAPPHGLGAGGRVPLRPAHGALPHRQHRHAPGRLDLPPAAGPEDRHVSPLSPWALAWVAAAAAIVGLYFLKPRSRRVEVSSIWLWQGPCERNRRAP